MRIKSEKLIEDLIERTRANLNEVEKLKNQPDAALNWKSKPESWSVLECIQHLNLYADYYNPEISKRINEKQHPSEENYKSGLSGNYFANMMLPREKPNKMKTFRDKNPLHSKLDRSVLDAFIHNQITMIELLNKSRSVSLNKTKCNISITKWLKLKLGDTFRVVIYHNQRHILQANKAIKAFSERL
ncbi:MAG: DinB family protein [Chitinophagales bacterium]